MKKICEKVLNGEIIKTKDGIDLFFQNVEDARLLISKIRKMHKIEIKFSAENLGFKKGRKRHLFVYSIRKNC
ncbi:MAG: NMD3-related protein [Archaeoglobaceae archaeon]